MRCRPKFERERLKKSSLARTVLTRNHVKAAFALNVRRIQETFVISDTEFANVHCEWSVSYQSGRCNRKLLKLSPRPTAGLWAVCSDGDSERAGNSGNFL